MFVLNSDDLSIYATRGDIVFFTVSAEDNGTVYTFKAGDVVRVKIFGKKDAESVVLEKDFPITEDSENVEILLTAEDTKIGGVISKPRDYWYEIELNPLTKPQTIIGYDENGPKIFKLFPEGADIPAYVPTPEDIPFIDSELDLTSQRPVENQAVAREIVQLKAAFAKTDKTSNDTAAALSVERARLNNLIASGTPDGAEVTDIRVGADGVAYETAGGAVRTQFKNANARINCITKPSFNMFDKTKVKEGSFLSFGQAGEFSIEGFFISDYMLCEGNTLYSATYEKGADFNIHTYDASKTFIEASSNGKINTSANARFIRLSYSLDKIDSVMFNKGGNQSTYQEYSEQVDGEKIVNYSVSVEKLKDNIPFRKIREYRVLSNNLCDSSEKIVGYYVDSNNGSLFEADGYITTGFIPVKENTYYAASYVDNCFCYDENGGILGRYAEYSNGVLKTLPNTAFIRISYLSELDDNFYVNEGQTLKGYDDYAYTLDGFYMPSGTNKPLLYTLGKAWNEWANNKKFPIGILGDSTTDGVNTTGWTTETGHEYLDKQGGGFGSVDYINENAYPYKLEQLIRTELKNDKMRVYNIGYSGFCFYTIMRHYDAIFSGVYSDVKMVGINMGINDRITAGTPDKYYDDFRTHLIETIEYLYAKGIQPFIITSQATIEPYPHDGLGTFYPLRTSEHINSIANRVKKEVAQEYGLELIDMTAFDEFIMTYSGYKITDITTDGLHYKDLGHTLEAEFLFSEFSPRTINATNGTNLDYSSQRMKSECPSNKVTYLSAPVGRMKLSVNYEKDNTSDIVMQDFIINITEKNPLCLTAYCSDAKSQYVIVDGEKTTISAAVQTIKTLDVGVHHIKAMSGLSQKVDWIGFTLQTE